MGRSKKWRTHLKEKRGPPPRRSVGGRTAKAATVVPVITTSVNAPAASASRVETKVEAGAGGPSGNPRPQTSPSVPNQSASTQRKTVDDTSDSLEPSPAELRKFLGDTNRLNCIIKGLASCAYSLGMPETIYLPKAAQMRQQLISQGFKADVVKKAFANAETRFKELWETDPFEMVKDAKSKPFVDDNQTLMNGAAFEKLLTFYWLREELQKHPNPLLYPPPSEKLDYRRPLLPCTGCRSMCCSNCLVPFKNGDKVVERILSYDLCTGSKDGSIPVAVAVFCILEPKRPLKKEGGSDSECSHSHDTDLRDNFADLISLDNDDDWEDTGSCCSSDEILESLSDLFNWDEEELVNYAGNKRNRILDEIVENMLTEVDRELKWSDGKVMESYLRLVRGKIDAYSARRDALPDADKDQMPTIAQVKARFMHKFSEYRLQELWRKKQQERSKKVAEEALARFSKGLPGFQLCVGCAELLAVLFNAWEMHMFAQTLPETMYYDTVMMGLKYAKNAQKMIFDSEKDTKSFLYQKVSAQCHPRGCCPKPPNRVWSYHDLPSKHEVRKQAVNHLYAYMGESYRHIGSEWLRILETEKDNEDDDEEEEEEDDDEEEESSSSLGLSASTSSESLSPDSDGATDKELNELSKMVNSISLVSGDNHGNREVDLVLGLGLPVVKATELKATGEMEIIAEGLSDAKQLGRQVQVQVKVTMRKKPL